MANRYKQYLPLILMGILMAAFYISAISALVFNLQLPLNPSSNNPNKAPTINITLYEGEISASKMGFGASPTNLTSPGPTLTIKIRDVVNLTVINVGQMPHAFAVTELPKTNASVLFNAEIGSAQAPLEPGQQGSVIFAPSNAGMSYFYICPISGHAELGMWGTIVVMGQ